MRQPPEIVILRLNEFRKEICADLKGWEILFPPAHIRDTFYAFYFYVAKTSGWKPGEIVDLAKELYL